MTELTTIKRVSLVITVLILSVFLVGAAVNNSNTIETPIFANEQMAIYERADAIHVHYEHALGGTMFNVRLITLLNTAKEDTKIVLHIAGYGGDFATGLKVVQAIKDSKAHTVAIVEGPAYSAFSIIALATNETIFKDSAGFLFHTVQKGNGFSKPIPATLPVDEYIKPWVQLHKDLGIFTDAEMKLMFEDGVDLFLTGAEVKKRLNK